MEEGKKMFSIFAARMFEQRVLQAYREKVAQERQQQLLRELEDARRRLNQRQTEYLLQHTPRPTKRRRTSESDDSGEASTSAAQNGKVKGTTVNRTEEEEEEEDEREGESNILTDQVDMDEFGKGKII